MSSRAKFFAALAQRRLPELVLLCGLVFTAAASGGLLILSQRADQARFGQEVTQAHAAVGQRIGTHIAVLRAAAGVIDAGTLSERQFDAFARRLQLYKEYPGIQGVGWSVRVQDAAGGARVWPTSTPEPHRIAYLYPLDRRNQAAIGYNMFSERRRRTAMERARDTGLPAITEPVQLVQEIDPRKQIGFLIYVPVYQGGGVPAAISDRRRLLEGFAYGAFRSDDLFGSIFGPDPDNGQFRISVFDGPPAPQNLIYRSEVPIHASPRLSEVREVAVAGRTWRIIYDSSAVFDDGSSDRLVWMVATLGLLTSLVLYGVARELVRRRLAAEVGVRETQREVEARRRVEQNQELLIQELNHRVKNTLATVQSIAAQTLRFAGDAAGFKNAFTARLIALSQAHDLLARHHWRGSGLKELIETQLRPFGAGRAALSGEAVTLPPAQAVSMSLAVHELATNSAKYGALSTPGGSLEIAWRRAQPDGALHLSWKERGGPRVSPPTRRGFGSRLLERGLAREFGGSATMLFEPDGLRCELTVGLAEPEAAAP